MREIKFRGKSIETGDTVYGSLINNMFVRSKSKEPIFYIVDPDQFDDYDSFEDIEHLVVEVDPETVGQFTGLKDRNDKEIYEDDIVKGSHRSNEDWVPRQQVKFVKGCFIFGNWNAHEYFNKHTHIEVIGNIHDNPEVLEAPHD
jgi:uncharacterized phage protein (TIGR01671 family)